MLLNVRSKKIWSKDVEVISIDESKSVEFVIKDESVVKVFSKEKNDAFGENYFHCIKAKEIRPHQYTISHNAMIQYLLNAGELTTLESFADLQAKAKTLVLTDDEVKAINKTLKELEAKAKKEAKEAKARERENKKNTQTKR